MFEHFSQRKFKLFVDFDGTITKVDVGESIFLKFGDMDKVSGIIKRIDSGELPGFLGWKELFDTLSVIDENELNRLIDSILIDQSFNNLIDFSKKYDIDLFILSDGFDYYINKILNRENMNGLKYYSNNLSFSEEGLLVPYFPFRDEECKDCANCKRNHIIENSGDDEFTIYVGNGSSDVCPAQYCDFIFAKDTLLKYCEKERVSFSPYKTFDDVIVKLEAIVTKKRLKKRHQAELKRRTVYMQG